jgi:hypothetical protein
MMKVKAVSLPWLANVVLAISPVFCGVASRGMVTVWLDECVQPSIITVTIRAVDWFLTFMINLLCPEKVVREILV